MKPRKYKTNKSRQGFPVEEIKQHINVLKEHFDDKIGIIAEQHGSINKKLDEHSRILNEHSEVLNEHSEILNKHSEILNAHSQQFSLIRDELELIKTSLRRKVDYSDFEVLEKRVARLELKLKAR